MAIAALDRWTHAEAADLYGVSEWSAGFFEVSEAGEVNVRPRGPGSPHTVSLPDIIDGLKERGIDPPVLLRFSDILDARVRSLNEVFRGAMAKAGYSGDYRGVYPVKVNQQQHVVEEVVSYGAPFHHGLEVGSKAELIAAMAHVESPDALVICNGYKDEEFICLGLAAQKMGMKPFFVIEMAGELQLILRCAEKLNVTPSLGVRVRLASRAGGHWSDSAGDLSTFGLSPAEIIDLVDELRECGSLDWLRLLHYHLGSQIPNIRNIRAGISEAARYYVDLAQEGAPLGYLDVGGGLAVDYDGSHTNFPSSSNYTVEEYCADIIETVMAVADDAGVEHPTIVSEAGRATVAYHSVLIFNVLDASRVDCDGPEPELPDDSHEMLLNLLEVKRTLTGKNVQEGYHDATYYRDQIRSLFAHGAMSLRQRAAGERLFWDIVSRIAQELRRCDYVPDELEVVPAAVSDTYYCNFSVFQSLPDSWAIRQLFPIMPLHRLNERPTRYATLSDITCDCDGKIDRFIDLHDVKRALPVHELDGNEYYLGVFLVGAYQEALGDLHNLLGDPNVVGVHLDADGRPDFTREIVGDSVSDVLSYVEYDPKTLVDCVRRKAEQAVRSGLMSPAERRAVMEMYQEGLRGYTYYER